MYTHVMFFFKQKSAYEVLACLEFRRVLFRSSRFVVSPSPSWPNWFRPHDTTAPVDVTAKPCSLASASWRTSASEVAWVRSEERRVGKEWRSRWSPYH